MKPTLFCSLTIFMTFIGCNMNNQKKYPSEESIIVNMILDNSAIIIEKKYNIQPIGSGAAMPGGNIKKLSLDFNAKGPFSKAHLRVVLIGCANELLNQINTNEKVQRYLANNPFTIRNVQIVIYNYDKDRRRVYDPEISTADISEGILTYQTKDEKSIYGYKNTYTETYEEALQALQSP